MNVKSKNILYSILALGILSRFVQYFHNRSLWFDEAGRALKVIHLSIPELFNPLANAIEPFFVRFQTGSIGFFLINKITVMLFGSSEFALRSLPLLCSIASLFFFYLLLSKCLSSSKIVLAGLALFAFSEYSLYYSTEFKPYSADVLTAVILSLSFIKLRDSQISAKLLWSTCAIGLMCVLLSLSSVFIISGGCISLGLIFLSEKDHLKTKQLLILCACWLSLGLVYYFQYLKVFADNSTLEAHFRGFYAPLYPLHKYDIPWYTLQWYGYAFFKFFKNPIGMTFPLIGAILFFLGMAYLKKEKKYTAGILLWPVVITLLASALHKYPFYGRTILFLVPAFIIIVFAGLEYIESRLKRKESVLVSVLLILMLTSPVLGTVYNMVKPVEREEIKPIMSYLKANKGNERIYLYFGAEHSFRYYAPRYGFSNKDFIIGRNIEYNFEEYKIDLDKIRKYDKIWLVFSHVYRTDEQAFLKYLDQYGKQRKAHHAQNTAVYLYEFL